MTYAQLITSLVEDCRIERSRVEDLLVALKDVCIDALKKEENVALGPLGYLIFHRAKNCTPCVQFRSSVELRNALGMPEPPRESGPLCKTCKKNPRRPRGTECGACKMKRHRAKAKRS